MKRKVSATAILFMSALLVFSWVSPVLAGVPVKSISLNADTLTIQIGKTARLVGTIAPANATNKVIKWSSSDSRTAKVDSKGIVKALSAGKATITAKSADGKVSAKCAINVIKSLKHVELIFYAPGNAQFKDTELVENAMNKILNARINASIRLYFINLSDYITKIIVMSAAGDPFDICFSADWLGYYDLVRNKEAFAELNDLLPKYASEYLKEIPEYVIKANKVNGKIYGAPNLQGMAYENKIFVNGRIFDKYKLPSRIKSINDLAPYLEAIKKGEPGVIPMYPNAGYWYPAVSDITPVAGPVGYTQDFKYLNYEDTDLCRSWFRFLRNAYLKGWISKNASTQSHEDNNEYVKAGKVAMTWGVSCPQFDAAQNITNYAPVTIKYISFAGAKHKVSTHSCISGMLSINATGKNKERAVMLINLLNTDKDLYNTICYGVEGRHYVKMSDGIHYGRPAGVTDQNVGYNPCTNWAFGYTYNALLLKGTDPGVNRKQFEYDRNAYIDKTLGYSTDVTGAETEINDVTTVYSELGVALNFGTVDLDANLPVYYKRLKDAGIDKIISVLQKDIDKWKAVSGK